MRGLTTQPRLLLTTNWQAHVGDRCVGAVVCKLDKHGEMMRGYIAMLVVEKPYRKYKIGACQSF